MQLLKYPYRTGRVFSKGVLILSDMKNMFKNKASIDKGSAASRGRYGSFDMINGEHPLKSAVPDGYVEYSAKRRNGGKVFYFNFELAKEMGLIPADHPHGLNRQLSDKLLDTFSLEVINEYELERGREVPDGDLLSGRYMATRYLQLQHPGRAGLTSGDGRSIWNGCFRGKDATWDISSCGTGVTRLSPATAHEGRYFKSGDKNASYGSGRGDLLDGVGAALMSDIYHRSGVSTERTLVLIGYPDGTSVNVRAAKNLLRPAHFFHHLKQGQYQRLKAAIDLYIDRQVGNREWPRLRGKARYQQLLNHVAEDFGRMAARLESDYIFCWMDWDGDNILVDGGIIDYGSLRQFGLFHYEYRYDDVDRMSTTITEQKNKAKYIVQTFAQLVDFLMSGVKRPIKAFAKAPAVRTFLDMFEKTRYELLLYKIGFDEQLIKRFLRRRENVALIESFRRCFSSFERSKSQRGLYAVGDGISWDAVFCMRDILRELPLWFKDGYDWMDGDTFIDVMRSDYADDEDVVLTPYRRRQITLFQKTYWQLIGRMARIAGTSEYELLEDVVARSAVINRYERVTGDSLIYVAQQLIKLDRNVTKVVLHQMFSSFVEAQVLIPEVAETMACSRKKDQLSRKYKAYRAVFRVVRECREGI